MNTRMNRASFAASSFGVLSLGLPGSPAAAAISWKWGLDLGPEHPMGVRAVEAFARIKNESNGQLDIKAYANGALGGINEMLQQTRIGALESCAMSGTVFDTQIPVAAIPN